MKALGKSPWSLSFWWWPALAVILWACSCVPLILGCVVALCVSLFSSYKDTSHIGFRAHLNLLNSTTISFFKKNNFVVFIAFVSLV